MVRHVLNGGMESVSIIWVGVRVHRCKNVVEGEESQIALNQFPLYFATIAVKRKQ